MTAIDAGDHALEAIVDGTGERGVVLCHPHPAFGGRMDTPLIAELGRGFVVAGFTVLRFHFRGIEGSTGKPSGGLHEHEDVLAAHRWLAPRHGSIAWVGYSFGALMALRALSSIEPSAYVGISIPTGIMEGRVDESTHSGLIITGSNDPLCDEDSLRRLLPAMERYVLPGEAHAFSHVGISRVVERAVAYVSERA